MAIDIAVRIMGRHIREYLCQLNWYAIAAGTLFIASTRKAQA